jgi:hypothetical protein
MLHSLLLEESYSPNSWCLSHDLFMRMFSVEPYKHTVCHLVKCDSILSHLPVLTSIK